MLPTKEKTTQKTSGNGHHKEPLDLGPPPPPPETPSGGPPGRPPRPQRSSWLGTAGWLIAILVLTAVVVWPRPELPAEPVDQVDARRSLGAQTAAIVVYGYLDFGCPRCRVFEQSGVVQQILANYPDQVRFVWRDFAVNAAHSPRAAEAALCASDQGNFWEYHDLLFNHLTELRDEDYKGYAQQLELDQAAFDTCLDNRQHTPEVQRDTRAGSRTGMAGPPVFVVDDQVRLVGIPNYEEFKTMIEQVLESRRSSPNPADE